MSNSISSVRIKRLLISHGIFTAGRVFFEIFLNVYIWKQTESFVLLAWFNIAYLLLHTVVFHLFAPMVKKGKMHLPRILALLGFALTYLVIFLIKGNIIEYIIPIGAVIGFFNGMYWISYQVLRFDLTNKDNRGNYAGFESGISTLAEVVMPALGGIIIALNFLGNGYSNLFLFGSLFFFASLFIGNVKFPLHQAPKFHLKKTFSLLWKNKNIVKSMFAYSLGNFSRGGALVRLILPLLIYNSVNNSELELGGWLSFFSVLAIIGSYAFGKFIDYKHYNKSLLIGGFSYFILILLVLFIPSMAIYVIFGALVKITSILINIPRTVISENMIHSLEEKSNHRIEYIVIREWFNIGFGRMLSFFVLFGVIGLHGFQMKIVIFITALIALAEMFFIKSIKWRD